jgi:hypothetical protein
MIITTVTPPYRLNNKPYLFFFLLPLPKHFWGGFGQYLGGHDGPTIQGSLPPHKKKIFVGYFE